MKGCFLIQELVSFAGNELLLVQVDFLFVYMFFWGTDIFTHFLYFKIYHFGQFLSFIVD